MTAVLILNIAFAALVVVGMLLLLGGAIVSGRRPGERLRAERGVVRRRSLADPPRGGRDSIEPATSAS